MSTGETGVSTPSNAIGPLPFRQPPPAHMSEGMYIPDRNNQQPPSGQPQALGPRPVAVSQGATHNIPQPANQSAIQL